MIDFDPSTFGLAHTYQKEDKDEINTLSMPSAPQVIYRSLNGPTQTNGGNKLNNFKHGTTTLGFVFKEGILLAVDSRASMGSFLSSEQVRKVIEINEYLLGTMAGGAADCQYWLAYLANHCRTYELKNGSKLSVAAASKFLQGILIGYKNSGLSMGCMIAGTDLSGQHLYYIDNDGMRLKGDIFSVGSGSTYAYGVLDNYYRYDLSLDEAVELGVRAIYHATHRDTASGGVVRVYHIHQNGWTKVHDGIDVVDLHYKFAQQKGLVGDGDEAKQRLF
ncbi:unnamed protein product [Paramecium octaurelia]|uniref:Proteasome subunit beta n=1 Tax=Paramecium octaurelia TaxID=43137 RepID=A0A8S1SME0_PAROT|nr:unnamed protein product [Paramecium octaurelia]